MPSLIDLRRRIRSVKNTQQITKAMKMVAASKLRRAQRTHHERASLRRSRWSACWAASRHASIRPFIPCSPFARPGRTAGRW